MRQSLYISFNAKTLVVPCSLAGRTWVCDFVSQFASGAVVMPKPSVGFEETHARCKLYIMTLGSMYRPVNYDKCNEGSLKTVRAVLMHASILFEHICLQVLVHR
jgi:hypothetical protein